MALPIRKDGGTHHRVGLSMAARKARRKFLRFFPGGFYDHKYIDWERGYKWATHQAWEHTLNQEEYRRLLQGHEFKEIADLAMAIEARTHLLYSFEKMALRDAVRTIPGARAFSTGLYHFLYGPGTAEAKFEHWCQMIDSLPRKQSPVLTWPIVSIFGFVALPKQQIYLKPRVTRAAALAYEFDFEYHSRPTWSSYASLLDFAHTIRHDLADLRPRDMIDIQSFIWVLGSDEYAE
jgi:hypothetical protein